MVFRPRVVLLSALLAGLLGCAANPEQAQAPSRANPQQAINQLVAQAERAKGPEKYTLQLQAAQQALAIRNLELAQSLVAKIPEAELDAESYVKRAWINSQIASLRGDYFAAKDFLSAKKLLNSLSQTSVETAIAVRESRAHLLFEGTEYQNALRERVILSGLLAGKDAAARDKNEAAIWQILMEMPAAELTAGFNNSRQRDAQGWYSLALASRTHQGDLNAQLQSVNAWLHQWPDHPAAKRLPGDLAQIKELISKQAKQIAVLLPQSGKLEAAANAIRDGLMAAYYLQAANNPAMPSLRFYNTEGQATAAVYDKAVAEGAQLIIGPLEKERVAELAARGNLTVPTLALNTLDTQTRSQPQLYEIGLAAEDEAKQIAATAWRQGKRKPLILAPNNNLGDRSASTFAETWRALGGKTLNQYRFGANDDFDTVIKRALQVDQSEERAKQLQKIIGPVQADPQRRQDVDCIFAVVQPEQARQLKPGLGFYFADDLPLYTTSSVFSGDNQNTRNQDLVNIRFLTLPWYFASTAQEKKALQQSGEINPSFSRLHALGIDVFNLAPRLMQIQTLKDGRFYGYTGTLQLNAKNQFEREQIWATFDASGNAQALSATAEQDGMTQ